MTKSNENNMVKFIVKQPIHFNPEDGYGVCQVTFQDYSLDFTPPVTTFKLDGNFPSAPLIDDYYEAEGKWINNRYGWTFKTMHLKIIIPSDLLGIKKFLIKIVGGIGDKKAAAIVDTFGADTLKIIAKDQMALMSIKGISKKKSTEIHLRVLERIKFSEFAASIQAAEGTMSTALRAYNKYGESALKLLQNNPYSLLDIEGFSFKTADILAFKKGMKADSPKRLSASIQAFLRNESKRHGHMFIYEKTLIARLSRFLNQTEIFPQTKIDAAKIKNVIDKSFDIVTKHDGGQNLVYLRELYFIEDNLATQFSEAIKRHLPVIGNANKLEEFLVEYKNKTGMVLGNQQVMAIQMVSETPFSVLTGGPGTGKTQTVNAILEYLEMINPSITIVLAAPTGKATRRLSEMTRREAQTLHRLIGIKGEGTNDDKITMITADILVIDEASMVDAYVFGRVMDSLSAHTRLLIIGDHEQLPSVGPGLVLRDLINSDQVPVTCLSDVFRQEAGSLITTNAQAIANGSEITVNGQGQGFYHIERSDPDDIRERILKSIEKIIANGDRTLDDIQVLVPTRTSVLGTDELNKLIQDSFNPKDREKAEYTVNQMTVLRVGDRVIQNRNDYDLGVLNGDVGKLKSIHKHDDVGMLFTVMFEDGREVQYDKSSIKDIGLAYALTIHKSQGSEFPVLLLPVHSLMEFMLSKNLIYTGITRASQMVVVIGEIKTLREMAKIEKGTIRNTRLVDMIRQKKQFVVQ